MREERLALLPLHTALFPNARMQLRLFEPRYLSLLRAHFLHHLPFGVACIHCGRETLREPHDRLHPPELESVGVSAQIIDWDALPGFGQPLQVIIEGQHKFKLSDVRFEPDYLVTAQVVYLAPKPPGSLQKNHQQLAHVLASLPASCTLGSLVENPSALQLGYQLAQYLPLPEVERYQLLELDCATERLRHIEQWLRDTGATQ